MSITIDLGATPTGGRACLDLEELLATRLLVQGNSGSGKSHLLRRLIEQSAAHVQQAILDPEGDFITLAEVFGHVVVDAAAYTETALQQIGDRARQHRVSVVLNLENHETEMQMRAAAAFLGGLFDADRDYWFPMLVVVDEAQMFAPAAAGEVSDEARRSSLGAMTNLMCRGRKRGLAGLIATQRLAKLAKNVAAEASNFLMGRTFLDIDMARAADLLGMERRQAEMFRDLARGQFIGLGPAIARRPLQIRIGTVETEGRTIGSSKLLPLPETPQENARDLLFSAASDPAPARPPRRLALPSSEDLIAQLAQSYRPPRAPQPPPESDEPMSSLFAEGMGEAPPTAFPPQRPMRRPQPRPSAPAGSHEAVVRQILIEPDAAFRSVSVLYQDFLVACRAQGVNGRAVALPTFRRLLANVRAGADLEAGQDEEWRKALDLAVTVGDDLQGLFLMLARAARDQAPCPSDFDIARARGSRSPRRARGLLSHMEQSGLIVVSEDLHGQRIIALPDLGWETQPGDPHAPGEDGRE